MSVLDKLPVATLTFIAGAAGSIIALANGAIDFKAFSEAILFFGGGSAGIGYVRNQAGKGMRGD